MDPMVDNSWIHEKRPSGRSGWQSKMMKTKVFMTVAVILAGTILAVSLNGLGSNATLYQSEGVVVDFGGYKTSWTDVDYKEIDDPVELLVKASEVSSLASWEGIHVLMLSVPLFSWRLKHHSLHTGTDGRRE